MRMDKRSINSKTSHSLVWTAFFLLLSIIYLETLLRFFTIGLRLSPALLYGSMFGLVIALILSLLICITSRKAISTSMLFILGFLYASQLVYFKIFRTFYIVYSAGNAGKVMEFASDALYAIGNNLHLILLMFVPLVMYLLFYDQLISSTKPNPQTLFVAIAAAATIHSLALILIQQGDKEINSPYNLYYNIHHPEMSIDNLGLLTYIRLDLKRSLAGWEPRNIDSSNAVIVLPQPSTDTPPVQEISYPPSTMNIDFNKLEADEADPELKKLHKYISFVPPTSQNKYTGIFEGYNLIFITAEGFSHLAIDPNLTPTLYKMYTEGFKFTNFYTAVWGVSTSDGEYVATTGLIPKSGVWSYSQSKDNLLPFTMGNQLKALGYTTKAYHNHSYDYYDRHLTHPNAGYDYKGLGNGLVITETWPESDLEMMELTLPEYMDNEPFHTYYMTISGHMRYTFSGNFIADKNRDLVDDLQYPEGTKAYLATQIELDRALEYLLRELEKKGLADKTLFALSTDHYPYALDKSDLDALAGHEIDETFELYKNAFILYAEGMAPITIDKPGSSLDILPTLSNLLGLDYDSRLLMGRDLLSDFDPLVIFYDRSFITDKGRFNSRSGVFEPYGDLAEEGSEVIEEYRKRISSIIDEKFYYSTKILELDYYRRLFE
jgi:hypothetical protein